MARIKLTCLLLTLLSSLWVSVTYSASSKEPSTEQLRIENINTLKSEALQLNGDLSTLEQEILYPLLSQFSVYLSVTDKLPIKNGTLTIKLDGQTIADYTYRSKMINALFNDAIQHLYVGKLKQGNHQLQLSYAWQDKEDKTIKGTLIHTFKKEFQAKLIEITMVEKTSKKDPIFKVIEWE